MKVLIGLSIDLLSKRKEWARLIDKYKEKVWKKEKYIIIDSAELTKRILKPRNTTYPSLRTHFCTSKFIYPTINKKKTRVMLLNFRKTATEQKELQKIQRDKINKIKNVAAINSPDINICINKIKEMGKLEHKPVFLLSHHFRNHDITIKIGNTNLSVGLCRSPKHLPILTDNFPAGSYYDPTYKYPKLNIKKNEVYIVYPSIFISATFSLLKLYKIHKHIDLTESKDILLTYKSKLINHSNKRHNLIRDKQNITGDIGHKVNELKDLNRRLININHTVEYMKNNLITLASVKKEKESLDNIGRLDNLRIRDDFVEITTKNMYMQYKTYTVFLGKFLITYSNNNLNTMNIENLTFPDLSHAHPHVLNDGRPCLGSFSQNMHKVMETNEIDIIVHNIMMFLTDYTSGDATISPRAFQILPSTGKYIIDCYNREWPILREKLEELYDEESQEADEEGKILERKAFMEAGEHFYYSNRQYETLDDIMENAERISYEDI